MRSKTFRNTLGSERNISYDEKMFAHLNLKL